MASDDEAEDIDESQKLSRHLFEPRMLPPGTHDLIWKMVFEFPGSQAESLFWHRFISMADIHKLGCDRQKEKQQAGKPDIYKGTASATSGKIRAFRTAAGHGFRIAHEPEKPIGRAHVHIYYDPKPNTNLTPSDKSELKLGLGKVFQDIEAHSC